MPSPLGTSQSHKKCVVSNYGGHAKTHVQFPCGEDGEYDQNEEYSEVVGHFVRSSMIKSSVPRLAAQSTGQYIFILGQVIPQGRRLLFFDYTGKK